MNPTLAVATAVTFVSVGMVVGDLVPGDAVEVPRVRGERARRARHRAAGHSRLNTAEAVPAIVLMLTASLGGAGASYPPPCRRGITPAVSATRSAEHPGVSAGAG